MVFDKTCPGSRIIREPTPEIVNCPECSIEVEIWTDELKASCLACGNTVYRAQQASCIDWCPHAKECVGPEVFERLKPSLVEDVQDSDSPLAILEREHERALEIIGLLRGAGLCLKMSVSNTKTPLRKRGVDHLEKVLSFFDRDLKLHFLREEKVLFLAMDRYISKDKNPTELLLEEHKEFWRQVEKLNGDILEIQKDPENETSPINEVLEISNRIEESLKEHIWREDKYFFPLARNLIPPTEFKELSERLKAVTVPAVGANDEKKQTAIDPSNLGDSVPEGISPTGLLKAEHQVVLAKLDLMEELFGKLENKEETAPVLKDLTAFFKTDFWQHFEKEERALFPEFDNFIPKGSGPLAVMMDEHAVLHKTNAELQQALCRYFNNADSDAAIPEIRQYGTHFIETLRGHITKEDGILFKIAEMHLTQAQNDKVAALFNEIENAAD